MYIDTVVWKKQKFSPTEKNREINFLVTSLYFSKTVAFTKFFSKNCEKMKN